MRSGDIEGQAYGPKRIWGTME